MRPTGEQTTEQINLFMRRRAIRDSGGLEGRLRHNWRVFRGEANLEGLDLPTLGIQIGQTRSNPRQVRLYVALFRHPRFPPNPFRPSQHKARNGLA